MIYDFYNLIVIVDYRPRSPPDNREVVYCLVESEIIRGRSTYTPVGTAFAISKTSILTAYHNRPQSSDNFYLVRSLDRYTLLSQAIKLNKKAVRGDRDEDWIILQRDSGEFSTFAKICPETDLPTVGAVIGIRDYPIGLISVFSIQNVQEESSKCECYSYSSKIIENVRELGFHFEFVHELPPTTNEPRHVLTVTKGRVRGSCGAPYFCADGKVAAFHVASVDDGEEGSTDRSHVSYSQGYVLCRLPLFTEWYRITFSVYLR